MQSILWRVTTAVLAILVSVAALTGCALPIPRPPAQRVPDPASAVPYSETSAPDASPSFGLDADVFAAAVDTYEDYVRALDAVSADGGEAPERIDRFVTDRFASTLHVSFASMRQDQIHTTGETRILATDPVDYEVGEEGAHRVEFTACLDVSGTRVVDRTGADVTPPQRNDHTLYDVFVTGSEDGSRLVVAAARAQGDTPCP